MPAVSAVASALYRSTWASFGRDQGIFHYVAWAIGQGERDYVDFREINGPFIHILHFVLLPFVGGDEHRFRVFDVLASLTAWAVVGALLPGIGARRDRASLRIRAVTRAAWAFATAVVLSSQYLLHDFWQHAQRESFYALFLLVSLALQMHAQRLASASSAGFVSQKRAMALAGALSAATWFGKPTCGIFAIAQIVAYVVDDERDGPAWPAVRAFVLGAVLASLPFIVFVAAVGNIGAAVRMILVEAPSLYRFIWHKGFAECYSVWGNGPKLNYAFATLAVSAVLIAARVLPRRFIAPTLFLAVGLVTFFVQAKGFPYHLHPITTATHFLWLAALVWGSECASTNLTAGIAATASFALAFQAHTQAEMSPSARGVWYADAIARDAGAEERFYRSYQGGDFYPWDMRKAAEYVDAMTSPDERVQTYGMDPYFLFLARRKSATPYIYSFELNVDAALQGSRGYTPTAAQSAWISHAAAEHAHDMFELLKARPPAAFVSLDKAPFTFPENADDDFAAHFPDVSAWLRERYVATARFGTVHVWLRRDVSERPPAVSSPKG